MPHRVHLLSLRLGYALKEALAEGYGRAALTRDIVAGVTVGVIAIPLAMGLAIASGVAPQYGLYTAILAGALIAFTGGSRFSISGPTAAFVVILYPLTAKYGLAGLLLATMMAGVIMIVMAWARLGRFIEYIPESVTLGFTGGIAIVIAVLQVPDFVGMSLEHLPERFVDKVGAIGTHLMEAEMGSCVLGLLTLGTMIVWPRLRLPGPPHLPALVVASTVGAVLAWQGVEIDTIGSRFHYLQVDGTEAAGIPPYLPSFAWPWDRSGPDGARLTLSLALVSELLPSAFAIAMLGAIESLLCAVVLDGMSGKRHSANSELLAQGLGNLVTPLFGGITATAAIARSATNFKAGAISPLAGVVHALVVLLGLVFFARVLAYVPMPAMGALLMMVAWNMSEAPKSRKLVQKSPRGDLLVFLTCLSLTVFLDMVVAITAGIVLASLLFMKEIASLTQVVDITENRNLVRQALPGSWRVFKIRGPLFFAAADRIFSEITQKAAGLDGLVIHMQYSSYLDAGGLSAIEKLLSECQSKQIPILFSVWQFQPMKTLAKARGEGAGPLDVSFASLEEAIDHVLNKGAEHEVG